MRESQFKEPGRFWSKVDIGDPDECWNWLAGNSGKRGYGKFQIHGRKWFAHRVVWVLTFGAIPKGLCVCHKCDNPGCCNPYHLFLGTHKNNLADASRKGLLSHKLTKEDVLDIREWHASGEWSQRELAYAFEVSEANISCILHRKSWDWLEPSTVSKGGYTGTA